MRKHILICVLSICVAIGAVGQVSYQWAKSVGSPVGESAYSVVADNNGYVYVTGKIGGDTVDFNNFGTVPVPVSSSGTNCYIAKYDSTGNCVWAKPLGPVGTSLVVGKCITLDAQGNIYVGGYFLGAVNFDPAFVSPLLNSTNLNGTPTVDAFIAKYLPDGTFGWVSQIGGNGQDLITSLSVDASGMLLCASGTFTSNTALFVGTTDTLINRGGVDAFVASFETLLGVVTWANQIGGVGNDIVSDIDAGSGYLVVTGGFEDSVVFSRSGNMDDTLYAAGVSGSINAFYGKYILPYGDYGWMNNIGGGSTAGSTFGTGVELYNDSVFYLTGVFQGDANFETSGSPNTTTRTSIGERDVYIAKYDVGENLAWAKNFGSANSSVSSASIALDNFQNIYLGGYFSGAMNFDPNAAPEFAATSNGLYDFYFSKYNNYGGILWERTMGGIMDDSVISMDVDDNNNIYMAGDYKDTVDFNPAPGFAMRGSHGISEDLFLAKYAQGYATIKGTVTYNSGSNLLNSGDDNVVRLYTQILYDGNIAQNLIAETPVDSLGKYMFTNIPDGDYLALAVPGDDYSSTLASSYYRTAVTDTNSVKWEYADTISAQSTMPAFVADIDVFTYPVLPVGTGILSGTVLEGNGFGRTAGTPIQGTDVGLDGVPGGRLATVETDVNGNYQFTNIPAGCYKIYINVTGLPMDSTYFRCVDSAETFVNLDFMADSNSIYIEPGTTGIVESQIKENGLSLYPNPYKSGFVVEFELNSAKNTKIELYTLLGKKIVTLSNGPQGPGKVKQVFDASDNGLGAGVYLLNIRIGDEVITRRVVQLD